MKNETVHGRTLAIISTGIFFLICSVSYAMFYVTGYHLYYFWFITTLFLGSTNLLFLLLKREDTRYKNPKPPKVRKAKKRRRKKSKQEEDVEDIPQTKERKKINFHPFVISVYFISYVLIFYFCCKGIVDYVKTVTNEGTANISHIIFLLILFVITTIVERLCKHSKENTSFVDAILTNSRFFLTLLSAEAVIGILGLLIEYLGIFKIQKYIAYSYTGLFFYYIVFVTISLLVILMRKELTVAPYIHVPLPVKKIKIAGREQNFIEYLEENTGITLRSLWSIKYIRDIAPTVAFMILLLLWLSTSIVQVETNQQAAIYRIGKLQEKILEPGIHLTLPYPFDKVEIYETETVKKVTIGYKAEENGDNIWTEGHGGEEYKLLLGGGDEVVSINLRLEYKISDLTSYLTETSSPESMMEALAYELITDKTIETDLSTLMSADRDEFSKNFQEELSKKLEEKKIGLEVVAVILESIHPPVDVTWVYQDMISAEITAEKYIIVANDVAEVSIANAEKEYDTSVGNAQTSYYSKLATAKSSVAKFMASVEANKAYSASYKYQKKLAAAKAAYEKSKLVILGKGVDPSALYFGNLAGNSESSENNSGSAAK